MLKPKFLDGTNLTFSDVLARTDLRAEADHDLAQRSIAGVFSYFVVWLIIYLTTELEHANDALLEFLGFMLAVSGIGRLYLALYFKKLHAASPRQWRWLFSAGALLSASIWGGVGALAIDFDGLGPTAVMVMLPTAAIAAAGIVSLAPAPKLGAAFITVLMLPSIVVAFLSGSDPEVGIALLFLTFLVILSLIWRRLHVEYWGALFLRSELIRAKEEAEAATAAKGQFIASVSHELRTPLTSVVGALGMIVEYPNDGMPKDAMVLVDMAYRNGKWLAALINDLLDFEKLEAHRMQFQLRPVDVTAFLRRALELNQSYSDRYRVSFVLEPPPAALAVMADEHRLMQVITNLLSNAAKHSPAGEQVRITVTEHSGQIRVAVIDHGPGVPADFRPRVFEKFAQAEHSNTGKAAGTGLGLAISKAIIEQMGGQIGFDSVAGKGATFFFELPAASGAAATKETSGPAEAK